MLNFKKKAMYNVIKKTILMLTLGCLLWSCDDDLDIRPEDSRQTEERALQTTADYRAFLAKIYAGISVSGQQGPAGRPDLRGLDEGFSNYLRLYWKLQELTTDEALIAWNDGTIQSLHTQEWTAGNEFLRTMYDRLYFQIAICNEFLRQSSENIITSKGVDNESVAEFRAETRFMRALAYWHAMDLYGNPTFVTEEDPVGLFSPPQIQRADLFAFIESELLDVENTITPARTGQYGRADQGAVWALLAKLYLNAEVYLGAGNDRFDDAITFSNKIIEAGYSIDTSLPYSNLFLADNDRNGSQSEAIFTIPFDGLNTQSFGGMTFLVHASVGGSMNPDDFGINDGWFGLRTTSALIDQFGPSSNEIEVFDAEGESLGTQLIWNDSRLLAYTPGQNREIENVSVFTDGFAIQKYRNITTDGNPGSDPNNHPDTDFHMFRLADTYLTYAEATLEGATNGDVATAVGYINILRERAFGSSSFNITAQDLTLDFILDERARELYWEGHRRTDLIRHNQFTENGVWPFKGGVAEGQVTPSFRDIMPLPEKELNINSNPLQQNTGY